MKTSLIKYSILAVVGILTAIAAIGYLYTTSQASTQNATVTGSANPALIGDNQTTVVSYRFDVTNPAQNVLDGVDLRLTYTDNLEYVSYDVVDGYLETVLNQDTSTKGSMRLMLGTTKYGNDRKSTATIRITFRAVSRGEATVTATSQSLVSGTSKTAISPQAFSVAQNVPVNIVINAGPTITMSPSPVQPSSTPGVTVTGIVSPTIPQRDCSLQPKGDANCDGVVNVVDFVGWRNYYLGTDFPDKSQFNPNFNASGAECLDAKDQSSAYCLTDLQIWTSTITNQ